MGHLFRVYLRSARPRAGGGARQGPVLGIPVRGHTCEGADRIRTGVRGFAGLCLTTRPPRRKRKTSYRANFSPAGTGKDPADLSRIGSTLADANLVPGLIPRR